MSINIPTIGDVTGAVFNIICGHLMIIYNTITEMALNSDNIMDSAVYFGHAGIQAFSAIQLVGIQTIFACKHAYDKHIAPNPRFIEIVKYCNIDVDGVIRNDVAFVHNSKSIHETTISDIISTHPITYDFIVTSRYLHRPESEWVVFKQIFKSIDEMLCDATTRGAVSVKSDVSFINCELTNHNITDGDVSRGDVSCGDISSDPDTCASVQVELKTDAYSFFAVGNRINISVILFILRTYAPQKFYELQLHELTSKTLANIAVSIIDNNVNIFELPHDKCIVIGDSSYEVIDDP